MDVWYRYESHLEGTGYVDQFDNYIHGSSYVKLDLYEYEVLRRTPKGVWLKRFMDKPRFVLNEGRKKFAHSTTEEALDAFIHRKNYYINLLNIRRENAEKAVLLAQQALNKLENPNNSNQGDGLCLSI